MHDGETVDGSIVRLATAGVVAYAVASPLMNLWSYLWYPEHQFRPCIVVLVLGAVPLLAGWPEPRPRRRSPVHSWRRSRRRWL